MENNTNIRFISGLYLTSRLVVIVLTTVVMLSFLYSPIRDRLELRKINSSYQNQIADLKVTVANLEKEKLELEETSGILSNNITDYQETVKSFNQEFIDKIDEISKLKEKYSYAITYSEKNPNADFGIKELVFLNDICKEYGIPIELMLAIYEKESSFCSYAKNSQSTATGYGQLINSTAKSMYEKYLNLGTYDMSKHRELACNKELNIRLSCRLIKYNIDSYNSLWTAVERYYGHPDQSLCTAYARDISSKMKYYGSSLK